MVNGYQPLSPLTGLLDNLLAQQHRQNEIVRQQGLAGLIEGIQQLGGGIGRGMMVKQEREREDARTKEARDYEERQRRMDLATQGARERRREGMAAVRHRERMKADEEQMVLQRLGVAENTLRGYAESGVTPPEGLVAMVDALRKRALGFTGAPTPPTKEEPPPTSTAPPPAPASGASLSDVLAHPGKVAAAKAAEEKQLRERAAPVAAGMRPDVESVVGAKGLNVRDAAEAKRQVDAITDFLSRTLARGADKIMVAKRGMLNSAGSFPKTRAGVQMNKIVMDYANGITDEDALVRNAMAAQRPIDIGPFGSKRGNLWDLKEDPDAAPASEAQLRAFARHILRTYPRQ